MTPADHIRNAAIRALHWSIVGDEVEAAENQMKEAAKDSRWGDWALAEAKRHWLSKVGIVAVDVDVPGKRKVGRVRLKSRKRGYRHKSYMPMNYDQMLAFAAKRTKRANRKKQREEADLGGSREEGL